MLYVKNVCKYLLIFTPYFSQLVKNRHVVQYDKLRFQPEIICNAVCEECLQISIYIYPLFFAIGEKRHVVEYDKIRFQREIICNVVCEECLQNIYLYLPPYFLKWCHATCC